MKSKVGEALNRREAKESRRGGGRQRDKRENPQNHKEGKEGNKETMLAPTGNSIPGLALQSLVPSAVELVIICDALLCGVGPAEYEITTRLQHSRSSDTHLSPSFLPSQNTGLTKQIQQSQT